LPMKAGSNSPMPPVTGWARRWVRTGGPRPGRGDRGGTGDERRAGAAGADDRGVGVLSARYNNPLELDPAHSVGGVP
jgi:hypothetical protein